MKVIVLMGSDTDWVQAKEACHTLQKFKVDFESHILSAHRSPSDVIDFVKKCENPCIFICAAGKAAHLAGLVASHTSFPVIGIPVSGSPLNGIDSLLSTIQMPTGVPVATVAIDGGSNAAILAIQILALTDKELWNRLRNYRDELLEAVRMKAQFFPN